MKEDGTRLTEQSLPVTFARKALLADKRLTSLRTRSARDYLEYHALKRSLELFSPSAFVPWVSYLFPPEILTSYGLSPLIPEVAAATLTGTKFGEQTQAAANRLPLSRDLCSYHRTSLAALREDLLPPPSVCLGTTPLCLGKECLLDGLAAEFDIPFYSVHVPYPPDEGPAPEGDLALVAEQLRAVHGEIGRMTGLTADLANTVRLSNRATQAWTRLTERRLKGSVTLNGRRTFALAFLGQILWGTESGAAGWEKLLEARRRKDLEPRNGRAGSALGSSTVRYRLLWLHTVPHHDHTLFEIMSSRGAVVAVEEMCRIYSEPLDPDDPFLGMAGRLVEHPLWGTANRRARLVRDLAERAGVDGVVHFNHWGCRHGLGSLPVIRETLTAAGIPFLAVDGDALDLPGEAGQNGATEQLESFLEILDS